jgi:hypothetical protein
MAKTDMQASENRLLLVVLLLEYSAEGGPNNPNSARGQYVIKEDMAFAGSATNLESKKSCSQKLMEDERESAF